MAKEVKAPKIVIKDEGYAKELVSKVDKYKEVNDDNFEASVEMIARVRATEREIDAQRAKVKAPVLAKGKLIDLSFRTVLNALDGANKLLTTALTGYWRQHRTDPEFSKRADGVAGAKVTFIEKRVFTVEDIDKVSEIYIVTTRSVDMAQVADYIETYGEVPAGIKQDYTLTIQSRAQ